MDHPDELNEQVRKLTAELEEMRARLARIEHANGSGQPAPRSDRRGFLKLGAGAVMGALGWAAVKVVPAAAATGQYMTLGTGNTADAGTTLSAVTNDIYPVFSAQSLNFSQSALNGAGTFSGPLQGLGDATGLIEGVDGWAQGSQGFGVYGLSDLGVGVAGGSVQGVSLYATGTGRLLHDPFVTGGTGLAPTYAPLSNQFEQVRDTDGVMWLNNSAAAWRRINSPRADSDDGLGTAFKPLRLVDTRGTTGGFKGPHGTGSHDFGVAGQGTGKQHIPLDAVAVFGNLTITSFTGTGWAIIAPTGAGTNPAADPSSINWAPGMVPAIANSFFVGLGTGANAGKFTVFVHVATGSSVNYIVDITGYVQ
jgi:hypothetical protein